MKYSRLMQTMTLLAFQQILAMTIEIRAQAVSILHDLRYSAFRVYNNSWSKHFVFEVSELKLKHLLNERNERNEVMKYDHVTSPATKQTLKISMFWSCTA